MNMLKSLSKSEQTTVMEIALQFLSRPHMGEAVLHDLDLSDDYCEKLRVKLDRIMNPVKREVTLNKDQKLYVIPCQDGGFTCHGFDVLFREANAMAEVIGAVPIPQEHWGTMTAYHRHAEIVRLYAQHPASKATWFSPGTPSEVRKILEDYRRNDRQIRVFLGDTETGRSWLDERDVIGTVGRSMGPVRVPLLCAPREHGGAILADCIIRLMDAESGAVLYSHPKFHLPEMTVRHSDDVQVKASGLCYEMLVEGEVHARFYTERQATDFIKFLRGERMRLPIAKKR